MKKITRRKFLRSISFSAAAVTVTMLTGCKETSNSVNSLASSSELLADPIETEFWTLEECKEEGGLYYKTDDDFFLPYNNFDCVKDIGDYARTVEAYIDTYDAAVNTPLDKLCFFMWPEYKSSTFWTSADRITATGWMPSIIFPGDTSYRLVTSLYLSKSDQQIRFWSRYGSTNYRDLWVRTINDKEAYQSENIVSIVDYGDGNQVNAFSDDAKGKWITLGYVEGTTLTEQDCKLSVFLGIYSNTIEDHVTVDVTPTRDGYAILDFSSANEGLYVLGIGIQGEISKYTLLSVKH